MTIRASSSPRVHALSRRERVDRGVVTCSSIRAMLLIRTYRVRGQLAAKLDPLGLAKQDLPADLTPEFHGFTGADRARQFVSDASGRVLISQAGKDDLRVPVYGAAKPVSSVTVWPATRHWLRGTVSPGVTARMRSISRSRSVR